jgi:hypothetical protein
MIKCVATLLIGATRHCNGDRHELGADVHLCFAFIDSGECAIHLTILYASSDAVRTHPRLHPLAALHYPAHAHLRY